MTALWIELESLLVALARTEVDLVDLFHGVALRTALTLYNTDYNCDSRSTFTSASISTGLFQCLT